MHRNSHPRQIASESRAAALQQSRVLVAHLDGRQRHLQPDGQIFGAGVHKHYSMPPIVSITESPKTSTNKSTAKRTGQGAALGVGQAERHEAPVLVREVRAERLVRNHDLRSAALDGFRSQVHTLPQPEIGLISTYQPGNARTKRSLFFVFTISTQLQSPVVKEYRSSLTASENANWMTFIAADLTPVSRSIARCQRAERRHPTR